MEPTPHGCVRQLRTVKVISGCWENMHLNLPLSKSVTDPRRPTTTTDSMSHVSALVRLLYLSLLSVSFFLSLSLSFSLSLSSITHSSTNTYPGPPPGTFQKDRVGERAGSQRNKHFGFFFPPLSSIQFCIVYFCSIPLFFLFSSVSGYFSSILSLLFKSVLFHFSQVCSISSLPFQCFPFHSILSCSVPFQCVLLHSS